MNDLQGVHYLSSLFDQRELWHAEQTAVPVHCV